MFRRRFEDELELRPVDERHADELTALVRRDLAHLKKWMPWMTLTNTNRTMTVPDPAPTKSPHQFYRAIGE